MKVLPQIISDSRAAFVEGCQILDAILIASESVGHWKREKRKCYLLKLDFEKANNEVDWFFLDESLKDKGFGNRWGKWIVGCISSANFSIMINSKPRGKIFAKRGLRKGDLLSLFLFTIIGDSLSCLIHFFVLKEILSKVLCWGSQWSFTHLQFANDVLLFCPDIFELMENWWGIFHIFVLVSGLVLKFEHLKNFFDQDKL